MILLLAILAVWGGWQQEEFKPVLLQILVSIITAVFWDVVIQYFKSRKIIFPDSAVISGLIIALVMAPQQKMVYYVCAASLAIFSKHLLRIDKKHIFNPANLGLLLTSAAFPAMLSWWGLANNWLLAIAGIFIVYKIRRFPVIIGYLVSLGVFLAIYSLLNRGGIFDYFSTINLFFVFVMLIEPKTSPIGRFRGGLFGALVAVFGFLFFLFFPRYDFALAGLALGNLANTFIWRLKKK
jgi:enediyne biosynthesis protein E5